jgi:hypothetical protein
VEPRYLTINPQTKAPKLTSRKAPGRFCIPLNIGPADMSQIHEVIYYEVMYHRYYKRRPAEGSRKAAMFVLPNAWTTGIGLVIFQGIVQGLAWDTIKVAVKALIAGFRLIARKMNKAYHPMPEERQYELYLDLSAVVLKRTAEQNEAILVAMIPKRAVKKHPKKLQKGRKS